jgi:acetyl esterase
MPHINPVAPPAIGAVFDGASVPAGTLAVTERLRREAAGAPPLSAAVIAQLRRPASRNGGALRVEPPSEHAVERRIDGPGGAVRVRLLVPSEVRACYLCVHGGGWALGGPDRQDRTLMGLAAAARVAVVAVDYRLAPEHPHPAAVADCVAALEWLLANGERELGASRVVVGGELAGAHLAALALLVLRDRGQLGAVTAANLAYGVYDVSMTPSARLWGDRRIVISTPDLAFFAEHYAPAERLRDRDVSPLYAQLTGLPPALFSCGTLDPLLDAVQGGALAGGRKRIGAGALSRRAARVPEPPGPDRSRGRCARPYARVLRLRARGLTLSSQRSRSARCRSGASRGGRRG